MLHEIREFECESAASELLALLREDALIKQHRPRYNVRQNDYLEYRYVAFTKDPYPRLVTSACGHRHGDEPPRPAPGARPAARGPAADWRFPPQLYGPYRDRFLAARILELLQGTLGIRTCSDPRPWCHCSRFDLGQCLGPCRGRVSPGEYAQAVARAVAFLQGDDAAVVDLLASEMTAAAEKLDFERAQELKERVDFCRRHGARARFLRGFREGTLVVVDEAGSGIGHLFRRGRLVASGPDVRADGPAETPRSAAVADPAGRRPGGASVTPEREDPEDLCFVFDRAAIVHTWLLRHAGRCHSAFMSAADAPPPAA